MSSISADAAGLQGSTRIIAHRGASGYLPEHTAVAKALAYGFGVDFIEQDVVATRDGDLVVLHDVTLNDVSDVAARFPERRSDDGAFFVADFTTAELRELELRERREPGGTAPRFAQRFPYDLPLFRVQRFEEEIRLIAGLNATTGRHVGIYPEIKDPVWHAQRGFDLTALVHNELERLRDDISGPVFIQCFDSGPLLRLRDEYGSSWSRVRLLDQDEAVALSRSPQALATIARYADGVGLPYTTLIERSDAGLRATGLASALQDAGLVAHPYTMRRDARPPPGGIDYFEALRFLILELEVDAIFCDQPDDALAIRARRTA